MPDELKPNGAEPVEKEPLSYEADLDADVLSAVREVSDKAPSEPVEPAAVPGDKAGQTRDSHGRFAKKEGEAEPVAGEPTVVEPSAVEPAAVEPAAAGDAAAVAGPPPGWSVASKAAWDALPDHIRADVAKREAEMNEGLAALRDFKDVKPYAEMARQSGTTLPVALQRYTTMEQTLRQDPMQGMMAIAHNVGLTKQQAAQLFSNLGAVLGARPVPGYQSNSGQPSANGLDQNDPLVEILGPILEQRLGPVAQKLSALETHLTRQQQADQNVQQRGVSEAIEKFAADPKHRYFPDLEETISRLFETGMVERTANPAADLAKAYEMAAQLHPEVRETLISERLKTKADEAKAMEQQEAARARAASRSITGSATAGTEGTRAKKRDGVSYEADLDEDVRASMREVAGRA
jgi:hypothetical protein